MYEALYLRLEERSPRGQRITASDADALHAQLPAYLRDPFTFTLATGVRRGQLSRTLRSYVDLDGECITWPASETKADEEHPVPVVGEALDVVQRNMAQAVPWCPYLFHGLRCLPGRTPGQWGCLGDFKAAWRRRARRRASAIGAAHDTRVTAATELRAAGLSEGDCVALGGWKTRAVFDRYNLGDVEALRARLATAREQRGRVVALRRSHGGTA